MALEAALRLLLLIALVIRAGTFFYLEYQHKRTRRYWENLKEKLDQT